MIKSVYRSTGLKFYLRCCLKIWGITQLYRNSVLNSLSFERVFRENQRFANSQAIAGVCSTVRMKSILGVGPKVKESIEDPFK
jgi:hypothetical protein